jgi:hypothetical protein
LWPVERESPPRVVTGLDEFARSYLGH